MFGGGPTADTIADEAFDLFIGGSESANRPIRTEHQAAGSEGIDDEVEEGGEVGGLPVLMIGFGDHAGDLADEVWEGGELADQRGPGFEGAGLDEGFGDVIEDEGLGGEPFDQANGGGQLAWVDKEVVGESEILEQGDPAQKIGSQEEGVIGFILHHVTDPDEAGVAGESFEIPSDLGGAEIDPPDHTEDARGGIGQAEEPVGFGDGLAGLDGDGAVEVERALEGFEIGGQPIPFEGSAGGDPGVFGGAVTPEVLMGIDAHGLAEVGGSTAGAGTFEEPIPVGGGIGAEDAAGTALDGWADGSVGAADEPAMGFEMAIGESEVGGGVVEGGGQVAPARGFFEAIHEEAVIEGVGVFIQEGEGRGRPGEIGVLEALDEGGVEPVGEFAGITDE